MLIGIVVNVMEEEHAKEAKLHSIEPTMSELQDEIKQLKQLVIEISDKRSEN
jgi:voltage-gated sodium channel